MTANKGSRHFLIAIFYKGSRLPHPPRRHSPRQEKRERKTLQTRLDLVLISGFQEFQVCGVGRACRCDCGGKGGLTGLPVSPGELLKQLVGAADATAAASSTSSSGAWL